MAASSSLLGTAPAAEPAVKLRSACDSCSVAKVKCDKKHPQCDRCVSSNFTCSYSPSRRFGKHSLTRRPTNEQRFHKPTIPSGVPSASAFNAVEPMDFGEEFDYAAPSQGLALSQIDLMDMSANYNGNGHNAGNAPALGDCVPQCAQLSSFDFFDSSDWQVSTSTPYVQGHDDQMHTEMQVSHISHISPNPASPCPILGISASQMPASLSSGSPAIAGTPGTWVSTDSSRTSIHGDRQEHSIEDELPIHDCEARAMATLESLYYCKMIQTKTPGQDTVEKTLNPVPNLDRMLHFNKNAVSSLNKLLDCPCARQVHLTLLYMSILSKALFWYGLAVSDRVELSSGNISATNGGFPGPGCSASTTPSSGRAVKLTRINMGVFNLEDEDQRVLIRNIVLREVLKLKTIADKMGDLARMQSSNSEEEDGYSTSWYGVAREKFSVEIEDTLKKVRRFAVSTSSTADLS